MLRAFQCWIASLPSRHSTCPTISSTLRNPNCAMYSRISSAMNIMRFTTCSGLPSNFLRSSGSCVATPTGQVLRWHTRIMMHPEATSAALAKPNSSAPSSAAIATSRPVLSWPSVSTWMRPRRPFITRICWVSASPSSHGTPACLIECSGEAPVPPSCPLISTTSALAFATPAAIGADADLGYQLDADPRAAVGVLQIVDKLRQVLDRINVVMRRRRNQSDARQSSSESSR